MGTHLDFFVAAAKVYYVAGTFGSRLTDLFNTSCACMLDCFLLQSAGKITAVYEDSASGVYNGHRGFLAACGYDQQSAN